MTTTSSQQQQQYDYDYLVIGGGSGGNSSAKRAAINYQQRVAIIEGARWGGTCVNVGCVPKKIMYQAASLAEMLKHDVQHYELTAPAAPDTIKMDWTAMKTKRDAYIVRLNNIYKGGLEKAGVTLYEGWGSFVDAHTVKIVMNDGAKEITVTAAHILIATGGKPMIPNDVVGIQEHTITSDGFFALTEQPTKAVVVGAGYIAVELAGVFHGLGTETHLVVRKSMALRDFDPDIGTFLDQEYTKHGITIHRNTKGAAKIEPDPVHGANKKIVTCVNGDVIDDVDCVLIAPGRVPNVDGLHLEAAGVKQDGRKGYIMVDDYQNTNVDNIYALGDVAGLVELTPMAIAAGRRLADRLFGEVGPGKLFAVPPKASYENVPTVVFAHPPIATCGLTEPKAIAKYGENNLKIYKSTFVNLYYATFASIEPSAKPKTLMKIICAGVEEQVVGVHMIGMGSDEIMQGVGVAMKMGCTKADLDACVAIHPTAAEELVTMGTWGVSPQHSGAKVPPLAGAPMGEPTLQKSSKM